MDKKNGIVQIQKTKFWSNSINHSRALWYLKEKNVYRLVYKYIKPLVNERVYFNLTPKQPNLGKRMVLLKTKKLIVR